ncbi:MAG: DUF4149 domain-containing protein [Candidatus Dadabacteria bacterium]|nr:MAG: DUF4149 domain-containing protein [Candidatus Dadabacteria bacterium]
MKTAPMRSVFVLSLVLWIGSVWFYSLVVLPVLFSHLPRETAGSVAALVFPYYYRVGAAAGAVAAVLAVRAFWSDGRRWLAAAALLLVMLACQLWSTFVIHPRMEGLRREDVSGREFARMHRRSVLLNGVVVSGGLILVCASGWLLGESDSA